jgi:hypothetical protein
MNKVLRMKKKLIKTGIICGVIVLIASGGYFGVNSYFNHLTGQKLQLNREFQGLEANYKKLVQQHTKATQSLALYKKLTEGDNGKNFSLDRKTVTQLLDELNENYLLSNLNLAISPAIERKGSIFDRKTGKIITSEVKISFKGITDEFAYSFLNDVVERFPGYVNLTRFSLSRIGGTDRKTMYNAQLDAPPTFIEASIGFDWLGMQIEEKSEATTPAAAGGRAAP